MSTMQKAVRHRATSVSLVETLDELAAIHRPGNAAAIWQRSPLKRFQEWLDMLDPALLPQARMVVQPSRVRDAVIQSCELAGTPDCPERTLLVEDIAALAHVYAEISSARYLRLRLDIISTNACSKFHIDAVRSRLICTYRGTGTQYGFSNGGKEPHRVFTAPTGSPIVLRGTLWPNDSPTTFLHRSPPISGTGETRLLLVLDPLEKKLEETVHIVH